MKRVKSLALFALIIQMAGAQSPEIIKKDKLLSIFRPDSGMWVVNSWATWCKPCIMEMPVFGKADSVYPNLNFVFVSYDFAEDSSRVSAFIKKHRIPGSHYLIDETDMNALINAVDSGWSGSLPATWFISPVYLKPVYYGFGHFDDIKKEIDLLIAASDEED